MKSILMRIWGARRPVFAAIVAIVVSSACGGGGGDNTFRPLEPPAAQAGGIWDGTVTLNGGPIAVGLVGASTDAGEIRLADGLGNIYAATLDVDGDALTGTVRAFAPPGGSFSDGSVVTTGQIDATLVERTSMTGTFSLDSGDTGVFAMPYDDLYERFSSLARATGMWIDEVGTVYTVQADGTFFGQDALGCVYNGLLSIIDSDFNVYGVEVRLTQCPGFEGVYQGLGAVIAGDLFHGWMVLNPRFRR